MTVRLIIYSVLMWSTLIYVMRRGNWTERSAAWLVVIASLLTGTVGGNYGHLMLATLAYDSIFFLAFFAIGLFSGHYWPMWVAAMAGVTVLGHLLAVMPLSNPGVYREAIVLWSWPILLTILGASLRRNRKARAKVNSSS